jgi:hypothetical protein
LSVRLIQAGTGWLMLKHAALIFLAAGLRSKDFSPWTDPDMPRATPVK